MASHVPFWAPVGSPDGEMYTQLYDAAKGDRVPLIEEALSSGVKCDALFHIHDSDEGTTALHEAARRGNANAVRCLIAHGAWVDVPEHSPDSQFDDNTPLYCAAQNAHPQIVEILLKAGANPKLLGSWDNTSFAAVLARDCYAAGFGKEPQINALKRATVQAFIDYGLDINDRENFHDSTVAEQAVQVADKELIQTLIDQGASKDGLPAAAAICHTTPDILEFLYDRGVRDSTGKALFHAARRNKLNLLEFLLRFEENTSKAESCGALHIAAEKNHVDILRKLLDWGLSPDARDSQGLTPLIKACLSNQSRLPAARILLEYGARINASALQAERTPCIPGDTALHVSLHRCLEDVVSILLEQGADVHCQNEAGQTPLSSLVAVTAGPPVLPPAVTERLNVLRMLLDAGSDVNTVTNAGNTPLQILAMSSPSRQDNMLAQATDMLQKDGAGVTVHNTEVNSAADLLEQR